MNKSRRKTLEEISARLLGYYEVEDYCQDLSKGSNTFVLN